MLGQLTQPRTAAPFSQARLEAGTRELYERLGRFNDLIFCPLDLPAPPRVARRALLEWVGDSRARRMTNEERLFVNAKGSSDGYPYHSAYAARGGEWCDGFDARFPEVAAYLDLFPTTSWLSATVLLQEPRHEVWLHTDRDPVLGWRVYLGHGGARLYFCPTFKRHHERLSTWTAEGMRDWSQFVRTEQKLYASVPASRCSWVLTSYRAAHGVEPHPGEAGERVTLVMIPDLDHLDLDAYLALLERSVEKYRDYAIWYPGEAPGP